MSNPINSLSPSSPSRRTLLRGLGGLTLAGLMPGLPARATNAPWATAFAEALAADPRLIGWQGHGRERHDVPLTMEGHLPDGFAGTFYRNGPGDQSIGGQRYHHWFDGDGFVQAWRLGPDGGRYSARFVQTPKRRAEQAAGRPLTPAFGTLPPGVPTSITAEAQNPANISVLPLAGRLFALWEAGSAFELDPTTLETLGRVDWRPDLAALPFSAHPKVMPDGSVWNFGVAYPSGRMMVWHIGADGRLRRHALLEETFPGFLHDMAVTDRHLIFVLSPLTLDAARRGTSFLDALRWDGTAPARILALNKDDLSRHGVWEVPAGFGFHVGNAWEDTDGTLRFDYTWAPDATVLTQDLRAIMRGRLPAPSGLRLSTFTLPPGGAATVEALDAAPAEFPRVDPRVVGRRHRSLFHLMQTGDAPWFNAVARSDPDSGVRERFVYGEGIFAEEHVFVPRPGSTDEGDGWLLGTILDTRRQRSGVTVLDARRLSAGPLALGWLDGPVPLGLHGAFRGAFRTAA